MESGGFVQRFIEKKIPIHFQARAPSAADGDGGVGMEDGSAASELRPDRPARSIYLPILKFFKRGSVTTGVKVIRDPLYRTALRVGVGLGFSIYSFPPLPLPKPSQPVSGHRRLGAVALQSEWIMACTPLLPRAPTTNTGSLIPIRRALPTTQDTWRLVGSP